MAIIKRKFIVENMTCQSCEKIITKRAMELRGVKSVQIDFCTGKGIVEYNDKKNDIDTILYKIEEKGYQCYIDDDKKSAGAKTAKIFGWIFGIIGILIIGYFLLGFIDTVNLPQLSPTMSLWLLFFVGLLTGFHCVAMCGGFVVSYTAKDAQEGRSSTKSHLMYATGKTLSYTIIGAIFGLIGSIIAFTPLMRGFAGIIAGLFLLIFGLSMLGVFAPVLRKFRIKSPESVNKFVGRSHEKHSNSPLIIGLLNGLMIACGPLQAIYIMAAGTGSWIEGAKLLFVFALGTLPVMLGFGYFASFLSSKVTQRILKFSGVLVIILGIIMLNNGLALTGSGYDIKSLSTKATAQKEYSASQRINAANTGTTGTNTQNPAAQAASKNTAVQKDGYQEIYMDVTSRGWSPDKFILKKGVPVKWIINGKQLNGCNNGIQVPKYGLNFQIKQGEQTIEFTPTESGVVSWSCWMGMIQGTFVVVDDINSQAAQTQINSANSAPAKSGGGCGGGGGGGCGCGMMR